MITQLQDTGYRAWNGKQMKYRLEVSVEIVEKRIFFIIGSLPCMRSIGSIICFAYNRSVISLCGSLSNSQSFFCKCYMLSAERDITSSTAINLVTNLRRFQFKSTTLMSRFSGTSLPCSLFKFI